MHCLLASNRWDAGIIVSANPGLLNHSEQVERIQNDEQWASRFLTEPWKSVLEAWNAQGVFAGKPTFLGREEKDFNRKQLADLLCSFSLGRQKNLRDGLKQLAKPLLWIAGDNDPKFSLLAQEMGQLSPYIETWICSQAGHRVPWENTPAFQQKCLEFLAKVA